MRVIGMNKEENWVGMEFQTTYKRGWEGCIAIAHVIWDYMSKAEVLIGDMGGEFRQIEISEESDFDKIPESSMIEVRGENKVYDDVPFQFVIFNQSDIIRMWLPTQYINGFRKSETEYLNEDEQRHTFDKFMDSIEVNAEFIRAKRIGAQEVINEVKMALLQYNSLCSSLGNTGENLIYRSHGVELNLTEIVNSIRGE